MKKQRGGECVSFSELTLFGRALFITAECKKAKAGGENVARTLWKRQACEDQKCAASAEREGGEVEVEEAGVLYVYQKRLDCGFVCHAQALLWGGIFFSFFFVFLFDEQYSDFNLK